MRPMLILKTGIMSAADIDELRRNHVCVVECDDPDAVRFIEPPPLGLEKLEQAAIDLTKRLLGSSSMLSAANIKELYVEAVIKGTRLETVKQPPPPLTRGRPRKNPANP